MSAGVRRAVLGLLVAIVWLLAVLLMGACGDDLPAFPKTVYVQTDQETQEDCMTNFSYEGIVVADILIGDDYTPEQRRTYVKMVKDKHVDELFTKPHVLGIGMGIAKDEDGQNIGFTRNDGTVVYPLRIGIKVEKLVDQDTLPAGQRIPNCIEGVPVQLYQGIRATIQPG